MLRTCVCVCLLLLFTGAETAHAQAIPSTIDPARLMPPQPVLPPSGGTLDAAAPQVTSPKSIPSPPGSDAIHFTLQTVTLADGTVYSPETIHALFAADIGHNIPVSRLFEMAAELTARYRADGYFLSYVVVPPQDVTGGYIILKAVEGYITEVGFAGDHAPPNSIYHLAMDLPDMRPLRSDALENILLRMSQNGGVTVQTTLMPASVPNTDGGVRLLITMNPRQGRGLFSLNNHGSRYIGPGQAVLSYEQPGLLSPGSTTTFSTIATPQFKELGYFGLRHQWQVGPQADSLLVDASISTVEPGYTLHAADLQGNARRLGLEWRRNLRLSRAEHSTVGLRFDILDSETKILDVPVFEDRLRVLRLFAERSLTSQQSHHRWRLRLSQGLDAFNASDGSDPDLTRADGEPTFTKFDADWHYEQPLAPNLQLAVDAAGQFAFDGLLASEEFSYGGIDRGRAYDPAEFTADHGLSLGAELRTHYYPAPQQFLWQPYVFASAVRLWQYQNVTPVRVVGTVGFGIRLLRGQRLSGGLSLAWPIFERRGAPTYGDGWSPRALAGITIRF